ncbi:MAG: NACHT domain-containing protein [Chloroflexota bacterium]
MHEQQRKIQWDFVFQKTSLWLGLFGLPLSAVWFYVERSFEPALAFLAAVALFFSSFFTDKREVLSDGVQNTYDFNSPNHQRNREKLLSRVESDWIEGVLKQSLFKEVRLSLGLTYDREAVQRPVPLELRRGQQQTVVSADKSIYDVFVENGRSLLILGEPGSGKTFALLELAERLIAEARVELTTPIPLIFNLASWSEKYETLNDWLKEEALLHYGISRELTETWLSGGQIILLLDGLDEVAGERSNCLMSINGFLAAQTNQVPALVVCSRNDHYKALLEKLDVSNAIFLQPLSNAEIQRFLKHEELRAMRRALARDKHIQELVNSPLWLNVIAFAYQGRRLADIPTAPTIGARRRHLFRQYIRYTFAHRPLSSSASYTESQTHHWLAQLANGMVNNKQSAFFIERLQFTWLPPTSKKWFWLINGLGFGLGFGLGSRLGFTFPLSLLSGILVALSSLLLFEPESKIELVEEIYWGHSINFLWLRIPFVSGLLFGLLFGPERGLVFGLVVGLIAASLFVLLIVLIRMIKSREVVSRMQPNQGIKLSFRNALKMMMPFGLVGGLIGGLIGILGRGLLIESLVGGLVGFLISGLLFGLIGYGGTAVIRHYALRYALYRANILPHPFSDKKLVAFLDAMAERLILRRVGGGWIFIHRTLLEYFAELTPEELEELGREA